MNPQWALGEEAKVPGGYTGYDKTHTFCVALGKVSAVCLNRYHWSCVPITLSLGSRDLGPESTLDVCGGRGYGH